MKLIVEIKNTPVEKDGKKAIETSGGFEIQMQDATWHNVMMLLAFLGDEATVKAVENHDGESAPEIISACKDIMKNRKNVISRLQDRCVLLGLKQLFGALASEKPEDKKTEAKDEKSEEEKPEGITIISNTVTEIK